MTTVAHDATPARAEVAPRAGIGLAVVSAASFGLSGALASGLMDAGWSAAGAVTARVVVAALVIALPAARALHGRPGTLSAHGRLVAVYGIVAIAGCQLAYFNAVRRMDVGVALLIEYTAPVVVVAWLWLRHGHRPGQMTVVGGTIALVGLVLVLDLVGDVHPDPIGVVWALGATAGAAVYFVLSASTEEALPPLVLAAGGLVVGAVVLGLAGAIGVVSLSMSTRAVTYTGHTVPWWLPVLVLGVVTAGLAYVSGIAATRRLGARVASFVALLEVLFALLFAWLLLDQLPRPVQFGGAALVIAGIVVVKLGAVPDQLSSPKPATTSRSAPS